MHDAYDFEDLVMTGPAPEAAGSGEDLRAENIFGAMSLALVDKMQRAFAEETGMSPSAVAAINQIGTEPGLSIERLRRIIALSHSATVRLVDQLAADGLVLRETASGNDRRARTLTLTEAGQDMFQRARAGRRAVLQRAFAALSADETRQLEVLIEKLLPALVDPGDDSDIVCRVCDESVCISERCPITHMHGGQA